MNLWTCELAASDLPSASFYRWVSLGYAPVSGVLDSHPPSTYVYHIKDHYRKSEWKFIFSTAYHSKICCIIMYNIYIYIYTVYVCNICMIFKIQYRSGINTHLPSFGKQPNRVRSPNQPTITTEWLHFQDALHGGHASRFRYKFHTHYPWVP